MSINSYSTFLCGIQVKFKSEASAEKVQEAIEFVEEKYRGLQQKGNQMSRESLIVLLALGLAGDLLELQKEHNKYEEKIKEDEVDNNARLAKMIEHLDMLIAK